MSDDTNQLDSELEEATDTTEGEAALETEDTAEDSLESTDLSSEKESSREEQRKKSAEGQIKKAQALIDKGEPLPDSLKWTLPHISPPEEQTDPKSVKANLSKDALLAELRDESVFEKQQEVYKKLPKELKDLVKSKYEKLRAKGFMKGEALSELLSIVNVKTETKNRKAASLPESGGYKETNFETESFSSQDPAKRLEMLKKLVSPT